MMKRHKLIISALAMICALGGAAAVQAGGYGSKTKETVATATTQDIVTTAVAAGSFKTLVAAVQAAGLVDLLKSEGPFTVFAPTDEAFAKLPAGTVEALLKDQAKLRTILTYHVVPGRVLAADVVKLKEAKTAEGRAVAIDVKDGVKVGGSKVIKTDIICTNGVIHIIDSVMLP